MKEDQEISNHGNCMNLIYRIVFMLAFLLIASTAMAVESVEFQDALRTAKNSANSQERQDALNYLLENNYSNKWVQSFIMKRLDDKQVFHGDRDVIIKWLKINNDTLTPETVKLFLRIAGERWRTSPGETRAALEHLTTKTQGNPDVMAWCKVVIDQRWQEDIQRRIAARYLMQYGDQALKDGLKKRYPQEKWRTEADRREMENAK